MKNEIVESEAILNMTCRCEALSLAPCGLSRTRAGVVLPKQSPNDRGLPHRGRKEQASY